MSDQRARTHSPLTVVFFGISGSGKGTQVELLKKFLTERDSAVRTLHFDMGDGLRELAKTPTLLGERVKGILAEGQLVPSFVASYVFTDYMAKYFRGTDHLLIDGTPRRVAQGSALDAQLEFYGRSDYVIVYFELSEEEAKKRLTGRGRADDVSEDVVRNRFAFYHEHVLPALEMLEGRGRRVIKLDARPTVEEIHAQVLSHLGLA